MLRLTSGQRELAADKLADAANLALGALSFSQVLAGTVSWRLVLLGALAWWVLIAAALRLRGD